MHMQLYDDVSVRKQCTYLTWLCQCSQTMHVPCMIMSVFANSKFVYSWASHHYLIFTRHLTSSWLQSSTSHRVSIKRWPLTSSQPLCFDNLLQLPNYHGIMICYIRRVENCPSRKKSWNLFYQLECSDDKRRFEMSTGFDPSEIRCLYKKPPLFCPFMEYCRTPPI